MKTEYFIELFERSHQYIDCDCARCKNSRQMAIGIIGTLFRDSKCVSIIKKKEDYSKQELIELFLQHVGTGLPILTRKKSSILTLGCQLSDRQMDLLVELVQSHDIFDFADNSDVRSELCRLFREIHNFKLSFLFSFKDKKKRFHDSKSICHLQIHRTDIKRGINHNNSAK